tara:strand:+ start:640 stop:882 length:243 start_codon:yes stop_codon:yes gene_type:complete
LIEKDGPSLKKIEGFNRIKNPDWDYETGLIRSYVVSGQDYKELYRINRNDSVERFEWGIPTEPNSNEPFNKPCLIKSRIQ